MGRILVGLVLLLSLSGAACEAAPLRIVSQGPVAGGRQFVVHSQKAGRDFRIQVSVPEAGRARRAPAVYVLDGDSNFGKVTAAARELARTGRTAPAFVVAIGYPQSTIVEEARLRDLVHLKSPYRGGEIGGGGRAFEAFVVDELRPFVEARYHVDRRHSVLMGHSVGGLFTATVMLHTPRAFGGYIIASPSLQFDPGLLARARAVRGGGRWVFIAVGGEEGPLVGFASDLAAALAHPGSGFLIRQAVIAGQGHMSMIPAMLAPGLAFVLPQGKKP